MAEEFLARGAHRLSGTRKLCLAAVAASLAFAIAGMPGIFAGSSFAYAQEGEGPGAASVMASVSAAAGAATDGAGTTGATASATDPEAGAGAGVAGAANGVNTTGGATSSEASAGAGATNPASSGAGTADSTASNAEPSTPAASNTKPSGAAENTGATTSATPSAEPTEPTYTTVEDGAYIIESEYGTVLDVEAAGVDNGNNVQAYNSNNTIAQRFYVQKEGTDENGAYYSISSSASGKAVDVYAATNKNGANVQIYEHNQTVAQHWRFVSSFTAAGDPCYIIVSCLGSRALDVESGTNGANVRIWALNGKAGQNWILRAQEATIADGTYVIEAGVSGVAESTGTSANAGEGSSTSTTSSTNGSTRYAVAIEDDSAESTANAQVEQTDGSNFQIFTVKYNTFTGYYSIMRYGANNALESAYGYTSDNTNVRQYTANGTAAQQWSIVKNATGGTFAILNAKSGKALTIDGTPKAGANLMIYQHKNSVEQRFVFITATPSSPAYTTVDEGTYIIESEYGTVMDVAAGSAENGANVQGWEDNATSAQRFVIKAAGTDTSGNTYYTIFAQDSGKAVDVYAAGTANGANIQIYESNKTPAQQWYFVKSTTASGAQSYVIINTASGKAIDLAGKASGSNIRIYTPNGKAGQNWILRFCAAPTFTTIEEGAYIIESEYGTVLDVEAAGTYDGANVQAYSSNNTIAQRFYVQKAGTDENGTALYSISSSASGKAVDVYAATNHDDTNVQIYTHNQTPAQQWRFISSFTAAGDPCYIIVSNIGLKALDVEGAENGSNVRIWNINGTAGQNWIMRLCTAAVADGAYVIEAAGAGSSAGSAGSGTGIVVEIYGNADENGTNVQLGSASDENTQAFALNYNEKTGYYTITNYTSGKVLDASNGGTSNNTNVWQYASNGTAAQQWNITKNANGTFTFANAKSGKALTINGSAVKAGANIMLYDLLSSKAATQSFALTPTTVKVQAGNFVIYNGEDNDLLWDVPAGSTSEGTTPALYWGNGTLAQKFVIEAADSDTWYIRPVISGQYVSMNSNGTVTQQNENASYTQKWYITPTNDGHFAISTSASGGMLIGVRGLSLSSKLYGASNANYASWNFVQTRLLSDGYYTIRLQSNTDVALEVYQNSISAGGNITTWHTGDYNQQKFYLESVGNGYYTIEGSWSLLVLDVESGSAKAGANVQQYYSNGTNAQKWLVTWDDGAFVFKSALGNFALSLSSLDAGSNAQLATYNSSSANQRFLLNHATMGRASIDDLISILDEYATGDGLVTFRGSGSLSSSTLDDIWSALYDFWDIGTSVGFTLIDLTTGAGITYNSDTAYHSACSIKAPYSIALAEYVPSSLDEWQGSFWHALDYSNNETYQAYFYNYGTWPLEEYNEIGHVENFSWYGWTARYSAEDLCRMWVVAQDYLLGGTDNAAWLRDVLSQNTAGITRQVVDDYGASPVYAKSGWTDTSRTEGCLVMDGDHPYVCAIMTTTNMSHDYLLQNLADALYRAHRDLIS